MQKAVSHDAVSRPTTVPARIVEPVAQPGRAPRPGIAAIWRDALSVFTTHAAPILFFALIGLAGPTLLAAGLSTLLGLDEYVHASGAFATHRGIAFVLSMPRPNTPISLHAIVLLAQAALGLFTIAFARGVITCITLQSKREDGMAFSIGQLCRLTRARLPALLFGSLAYAGLMAYAVVGVNGLLREVNLDLSNAGQRAENFGSASHVIAIRTLNAFLPDPGSPLGEFVPYWRSAPTLANTTSTPEVERHVTFTQAKPAVAPRTSDTPSAPVEASRPPDVWTTGLVGIALIVVCDTLLRFRTVAALEPGKPGWVRPVLSSGTLGLKHFATITAHIWTLRLIVTGVSVAFVILPVVLLEVLTVPSKPVVMLGEVALLARQPFGLLASLALINAIFIAFGAVYDARLYRALTQPTRSTPSSMIDWLMRLR